MLQLTGCQTWRVAGPTPTAYINARNPDEILVRRTDSSSVRLLNPSVDGDTLRGFAVTGSKPAIPLADVQSISVRRTSMGRTLGLVGAVAAGVALSVLLSCTSSGTDYC
jgi:hypothetical protein